MYIQINEKEFVIDSTTIILIFGFGIITIALIYGIPARNAYCNHLQDPAEFSFTDIPSDFTYKSYLPIRYCDKYIFRFDLYIESHTNTSILKAYDGFFLSKDLRNSSLINHTLSVTYLTTYGSTFTVKNIQPDDCMNITITRTFYFLTIEEYCLIYGDPSYA